MIAEAMKVLSDSRGNEPKLKIWKLIGYMEKWFCCEYSLSLTAVSQELPPVLTFAVMQEKDLSKLLQADLL